MQNEFTFQTIDTHALDTVTGGAEKEKGWLEKAKDAVGGMFGSPQINIPVTTGQNNKVQAGGEGNSIK